MKFGTKAVHAGVEPDPSTGAVMTPIFQTSTYAQELPGKNKGYAYARADNPTRNVLQKSIASLENGAFGLCFSSGMSATDTVLKCVKPGEEVIANANLYGGTYRIFTKLFAQYKIKFHFIDCSNPNNIKAFINDRTRLLWIETPTNPLVHIIDIEACATLAKNHNIQVAVDNTFASPYLQNPLSQGADIVMHSVTKYLSGHSDVIMGALVTNDQQLHDTLTFIQKSCGAIPSPHDCFLALRGIKTLHLRMERHCLNGRKIAEFLAQHDQIETVYWPGLPSHPNYDVAVRQMNDFGGMISFQFKEDNIEKAYTFIKNISLFTLAESLGGVESLINHPASMTHSGIPKAMRIENGVTDSLIRLSVGIEDADDLIDDLKRGLKKI